MQSEQVAIGLGAPPEAGVPKCVGRLVEERDGELELLCIAAIGHRSVRIEVSAPGGSAVIERPAESPLRRVLNFPRRSHVSWALAGNLSDELLVLAVEVA